MPRGRKIHRRSSGVFHRNTLGSTIFRNIGMVVVALLIIPAGFFSAKILFEGKKGGTGDPSPSSNTATTKAATSTTAATQSDIKPGLSGANGGMHAFYLPVARLNQPDTLDGVLNEAASAGFNAVVFDLKGEDGVLHYKSSSVFAQQSKAIAEDALTVQQLTDFLNKCKGKGIQAIPRLFAFRDPIAPLNLPFAKVALAGHPTYTWLDNSKEKGGKPWLNPCSADAHSYIIDLVKETNGIGFAALMLDGVQFPNQSVQAYYGDSELASMPRNEVLMKFTGDLKAAVGSSCNIILTMPGLSAFGEGTEPFGGNPVTFGADTVSPMLMPSTLGTKLKAGETVLDNPAGSPYDAVKLAAGQVKLRLELIASNKRPAAAPWLQAYDYNRDQVVQEIKGVTETLGSNASYILYNADGNYDFSVLGK